MTLVNPTSGEVVDIADADEARQIIADTSAAIAHMNVWTGKVVDQIVLAHQRRVWVAEGYGSWDELCEANKWRWKPLTSGERSAVADLFRQKGMSFRAIGVVLASSPQTIRRDVDGEFTSDHSNVPNGTRSTPTQQEATDDSDPIEGDAAGYGDGPLGHDEGETADEEASEQEAAGADEGAQATPVPPAALSHPDASPAHQDEGAASPSQATPTKPHSTATDHTAAPSTPDPLDQFRDTDDEWRTNVARQIAAAGRVLLFDPAEIAQRGDDDLIEQAIDLGHRFAAWADRIHRPTGLHVIAGGKP